MSRPMPELTVELTPDVGASGFPAAGDWVRLDDVNTVQRITVGRGRSRKAARVEAGELEVTFDGRHRDLDPTNRASRFYDLVNGRTKCRPNRWVRVRAAAGGTTRTLGTMLADAYPMDWGVGYIRNTLTATDAFKLLTRPLPNSVLEHEILADAPFAYWPLCESIDPTVAADIANRRDASVVNGPLDSATDTPLNRYDGRAALAFNGAQHTFALAPAAVVGTPVTLVAVMRRDPMTVGAGYEFLYYQIDDPTLTFPSLMQLYIDDGGGDAADVGKVFFGVQEAGDNAPLTLGWKTVKSSARVDDGKTHIIHGVCNGAGDFRLFVDGVHVTTAYDSGGAGPGGAPSGSVTFGCQMNNPTFFPLFGAFFRGVLGHIATFAARLTGPRIFAHAEALHGPWPGVTTGQRIAQALDVVDWPAGTDLDDGVEPVAPAILDRQPVLEYIQRAEATEEGLFFLDGDGTARFRERIALADVAPLFVFDNAGGVPYRDVSPDYAIDEMINRAEITPEKMLTQAYQVDELVDVDGPIVRSLDDTMHSATGNAYAAAARAVYLYQEPRLVLERLVVDVLDELVPFGVLDLEPGDVVKVIARPTNPDGERADHDPISQLSEVQHIGHEIDLLERTWRLTLDLAPQLYAEFMTVDDDELGIVDAGVPIA